MSKELIERVNSVIRELDDAERYPLSDRRPGYFERCRDALKQCRDELTKQAEEIQALNATASQFHKESAKQSERVKELEAGVEKLEAAARIRSVVSTEYIQSRAWAYHAESLAALLKEGE